jgi:hypothetical protein
MARLMTGGTAISPGSEDRLATIDVRQPRNGITTTTARQKAQMLKAAPHAVVVDGNVVKIVSTAQMK